MVGRSTHLDRKGWIDIMADDYLNIPMCAIGYNEKGIIAFMVGGEYLTYLDLPETEDYKEKLPYISDEDVKAINSRKE